MTMVPVLALLGGLIGLLTCTQPGAAPVPDQATLVPLTVTIVVVSPGGARPAPGTGQNAPLPQAPVPGVEVWAVPPGDATIAPEATALTDADGNATLQLSAGPHWVFVPRSGTPGSSPLGATIMREMPDGTRAPMWAEVDLSDGNPAAITLGATRLNP